MRAEPATDEAAEAVAEPGSPSPDENRRRLWRRRASDRRSRWRLVLLGGLAVMVAYYGLVVFGLWAEGSGEVELSPPAGRVAGDRIDMELEAVEFDASAGSFAVRLRPVPYGDYQGDRLGQLREPLQVQVTSPGRSPAVFDFPAGQLLDPVTVMATTTQAGARSFPFDRAEVEIRLAATSNDETVPLHVELTDGTEGWDPSGTIHPLDDGLQLDLEAERELLPISFSLMYVTGTVIVALITVAVIGGAIARRRVRFDQVIWLGAMLVAIPAVRNEMPGVPPVGTAVDLVVFLPAVVVVALALLAAIVVLSVNEARAVAPEGE